MQLKFFLFWRYLYKSCLFGLPLVFFSLTPKLLYAQEIETGKNGVDATLAFPISNGFFDVTFNTPPAPLSKGGAIKEYGSDSNPIGITPLIKERFKVPLDKGDLGGANRKKEGESGNANTSEPTSSITSTVQPSLNQQEELEVRLEKDAEEQTTPISVAQVPREEQPPSLEPLPEQQPLPTQPPPDQLLSPPTQDSPPPESTPEEAPATLVVERFEFDGNTVFSDAELADKLKNYTNRRISFAELLQARSEITQFYVKEGYTTSGAIIPQQKIPNPDSAIVTIKVVEGSLEQINITGTRRLRPSYISSRLALAQTKPLNVNSLLEKLQLLQLDPVIGSLSADLQVGTRPGTNILQVQVTEADTFDTDLTLDNLRSPTVGSFRRRIALNENNLLGFGDALSLGYTNTDGSNGGDFRYTFPVSPDDSKLTFAFGITDSNVIERPFDELGISSKYHYYELTFRHPIIRTPTEELAVGLTFSHQSSQTFLGIDDIGASPLSGPYPLAPGADNEGRTRVSALRFIQEWTKRSNQEVLAFRSQFSLGLDVLGATINDDGEPDSRFLGWRGQGQWARLLARDTLLLLKTDAQLSDNPLLGLEQFGIGGQQSVRGYRQDYLLKDNGFLVSAEVRLPILRVPKVQGVLQIAPFIDVGTGWSHSDISKVPGVPNTLVGIGVGLLWRQGDNFTGRLDFGIPLVSIDERDETWQENGIYFSIIYTPF
ncbi:ShlB/FhaC/HecB family hemolysin secretion/activation protein [Lyngbya aestuarii]|uniref:ShlB/FhaC/HecB family hemolysin secretion/activation protein n=1 Tax=Lyngbya aestuarii TaxID=118322 RepID=UPI00403D66CB